MFRCAAITVLAVAALSGRANATELFSGSTSGLAAAAAFTVVDTMHANQVVVLLTNTDVATVPTAAKDAPSILTGLFFNLGTGTFTPAAATTAGSVANDNEFYEGSIFQTPSCDIQSCMGTTNGGSSNTTGTSGNSPGATFATLAALNGIDGLVPNVWTELQSSGSWDSNAVIEAAAQFVLTIPDGLNEDQISHLRNIR